jgi:hypothetical protein
MVEVVTELDVKVPLQSLSLAPDLQFCAVAVGDVCRVYRMRPDGFEEHQSTSLKVSSKGNVKFRYSNAQSCSIGDAWAKTC